MKKGIWMLLALVLLFGQAAAAEQGWPDRVKVLLVEEAEQVYLEAKGKYQVVDPHTGHRLSGGSAKCYPMESQSHGLRWGEEYPDIFQVAILPMQKETTILVNGVEYRGAIYAYQVGSRLYVVNELPIEEYTKSLLAVRVPSPALEDEAIAALSIVMRSDAYSKAVRNQNSYWHVRASEVGYCGDGAGLWSDRYSRIVDQTHGMVLVSGGVPVPAQYTEHSAGRTVNYDLMLRTSSGSPLKGVEAPLAARGREAAAWNCVVSKERLAQIANLSSITGMNLYTDDFSGKVYAVRLYDGVASRDLDFQALQSAIGASQLRGSEFTVDTVGNQVAFHGHGVGAGVGLCLYSANELAVRGKDAAAILKGFFPQAQLKVARAPGEPRAEERSGGAF